MDPGTALAVLSIGIEACRGLVKYYDSWKYCFDDVRTTLTSVSSLSAVLDQLHNTLKDYEPRAIFDITLVIECISSCQTAIDKLRNKVAKFEEPFNYSTRQEILITATRRLYYPFKESTLARLRETIQEARDNLAPALFALQLKSQERILTEVEDLRACIVTLQVNNEDSSIKSEFLKGLNPMNKQIEIYDKRQDG